MKAVKFEDVKVGDTFTDMQGGVFIKQNDMGRFVGVCNAKDLQGNWSLFPMNMMVLVYEDDDTLEMDDEV
jgi:hypothetical protein